MDDLTFKMLLLLLTTNPICEATSIGQEFKKSRANALLTTEERDAIAKLDPKSQIVYQSVYHI